MNGDTWSWNPRDPLPPVAPQPQWPGCGSWAPRTQRSVPALPRPSTGSLASSKASQDRKLTSTPREITKSPHSAVPEHHPHPISPYEHLLRGVSGMDLYRGHIPLAFDPTSIPRGIPLDAGDCPGPTGPQGTGPGASSGSPQGFHQLGSAI